MHAEARSDNDRHQGDKAVPRQTVSEADLPVSVDLTEKSVAFVTSQNRPRVIAAATSDILIRR
jgi:hypothetical protein